MAIRDWEQRRYQQVFDEVCARLEYRRQVDPSFSIGEVEGLLETACIAQGNDWVGRGAGSHVVLSATIAAYEHLLAEWRRHESP